MMLPDFYRIRPFVRKAGVKVRVQEKLGLPFFLYRNRKRKLFAAGMASFFLLLFVLSRFIWNISFCGNLYFTDDTLMRQLREIGILYGMPKSGVDCDRIEEELRSRCPRIVWVSAHVSGTRLQIRVRKMRQRVAFLFGRKHHGIWWRKRLERWYLFWCGLEKRQYSREMRWKRGRFW